MPGVFFSIVVPAYNAEKYLDRCLQSVLAQDYTNWEVVIVDDGSTDSTWTIMQQYHSQYPNKFVIDQHSNMGQYITRLKGCSLCTGEYTLFVDADDYVDNHLLSSLFELLSEEKHDMVMWGWNRVDSIGTIKESAYAFNETGPVNKRDIYLCLSRGSILNSLCIKCVKTNIIQTNTFETDCCIRNGEDLLFTIPLVENSNDFFFIKSPFYYYFDNYGSISHSFTKKDFILLNVVRPSLFHSMYRMNYVDDSSESLFFSFYLKTLLDEIKKISYSDSPYLMKKKWLKQISKFEFVIKARVYCKCVQGVKRRLLLHLFYYGCYGLLLRSFKLKKRNGRDCD